MSGRQLPPRETLYKGIRMRSRLEADFARWLDSGMADALAGTWDYEPECFADQRGQYLPDFRIRGKRGLTFIEVKPLHPISGDDCLEFIEQTTARMEIVWSSYPDAVLVLAFWEYQASAPAMLLFGWPRAPRGRLWWVMAPGEPPLPWPEPVAS